MKRPFSKLPQDVRVEWYHKARKILYKGLEPVSDEKEKRVHPLAKQLYEAHHA